MTEDTLHKQICQFIKTQYPNVIFNTDLSGIKLTIGQSKKVKNLRSNKGMPDIVIYEPKGIYAGFFAELKRETPYKKNGELKKCEHLKEQAALMQRLIKKGYYADFFWSLDKFIEYFNIYMKLK